MATSHRTAAAGEAWREVFLSEQDIAGARSLAEAVQLGHSLLVLDQVATPEECADLLAESAAVAARVRAEHFPSAGGGETEPACSDGVDDSALALPPAACLMLSNSSRIRMPVRDMLSVRAQVSILAPFASGADGTWCSLQGALELLPALVVLPAAVADGCLFCEHRACATAFLSGRSPRSKFTPRSSRVCSSAERWNQRAQRAWPATNSCFQPGSRP